MQVNFSGSQYLPSRTLTKPSNFTGAISNQQSVSFTGINYGEAARRVRDSLKSIPVKEFFKNVKAHISNLPETLKPLNDFFGRMFSRFWDLVKPISTKIP